MKINAHKNIKIWWQRADIRDSQVFLLSEDVLGGCRFKKVEERTFTDLEWVQ